MSNRTLKIILYITTPLSGVCMLCSVIVVAYGYRSFHDISSMITWCGIFGTNFLQLIIIKKVDSERNEVGAMIKKLNSIVDKFSPKNN